MLDTAKKAMMKATKIATTEMFKATYILNIKVMWLPIRRRNAR